MGDLFKFTDNEGIASEQKLEFPQAFGEGILQGVAGAEGTGEDGKPFTELKETAGLGMRADEPAFKDQLIGKGGTLTLVKGTAEGESEISAITGASVTSGAVTEALNAGLELYDTVLKGGN